MATTAHCLYCFEVLVAALEGTEPVGLSDVEQLHARYGTSKLETGDDPTAQITTGETRNDDEMTSGDSDLDDDDDDDDGPLPSPAVPPSLVPPSISRIQAASPASRSSSSSTTPLSISSATSSQAALGAPSNSSSTSSFFSLSRPFPSPTPNRYPLFVTWDKRSSRGRKSLRGCIGTFDAKELSTGLSSYAQAA